MPDENHSPGSYLANPVTQCQTSDTDELYGRWGVLQAAKSGDLLEQQEKANFVMCDLELGRNKG